MLPEYRRIITIRLQGTAEDAEVMCNLLGVSRETYLGLISQGDFQQLRDDYIEDASGEERYNVAAHARKVCKQLVQEAEEKIKDNSGTVPESVKLQYWRFLWELSEFDRVPEAQREDLRKELHFKLRPLLEEDQARGII